MRVLCWDLLCTSWVSGWEPRPGGGQCPLRSPGPVSATPTLALPTEPPELLPMRPRLAARGLRPGRGPKLSSPQQVSGGGRRSSPGSLGPASVLCVLIGSCTPSFSVVAFIHSSTHSCTQQVLFRISSTLHSMKGGLANLSEPHFSRPINGSTDAWPRTWLVGVVRKWAVGKVSCAGISSISMATGQTVGGS